MITHIIFDMNGVIIDDEPIHELAFKKTCLELGIVLTAQLYKNLCLGRTDKESFELIAKKFKLKNISVPELVTRKSQEYLKLLPKNIKSFPGALGAIRRLSKSFTLALTTSANAAETSSTLKTFQIKKYFKIIVTADDIKHGKPHPEPYLLTAKRLKTRPANCLVIEDTHTGILSAKAAGMRCIAVANTSRKKDLNAADLVVDDCTKITINKISRLK